MSGQWIDAWDESAKRWTKLYIDLPAPPRTGTLYTLSSTPPTAPLLLGPDGKPLTQPESRRRMGFQP